MSGNYRIDKRGWGIDESTVMKNGNASFFSTTTDATSSSLFGTKIEHSTWGSGTAHLRPKPKLELLTRHYRGNR